MEMMPQEMIEKQKLSLDEVILGFEICTHDEAEFYWYHEGIVPMRKKPATMSPDSIMWAGLILAFIGTASIILSILIMTT